jgi:hypothetical protein
MVGFDDGIEKVAEDMKSFRVGRMRLGMIVLDSGLMYLCCH